MTSRNKRLKIRVEDLDDGEVKELEARAMVLCIATDYEGEGTEEDGVNVRVLRNLSGVLCATAIAMKLEEEPQQIKARLLSVIAKEDDAQ